MFNFRIIDTVDGNQIIDRNLKTPYSSLTPVQMVEYMEMDNRLLIMDRMQRKAQAKRKVNLFSKVACFVGLVQEVTENVRLWVFL